MNSSLQSRQIFTAINNKNTEEIRFLLGELGGYVNNKNSHGRTPLHEVAKLGDKQILKLFAENANVKVNVQDDNGSTPLHYVIEWNESLEEAYKILVEAGADIVASNKNGKTPLHILKEKRVDSKIIESLVNMKNKTGKILGKDSLCEAVCAGNVEMAQLLIDCGCDINNVGSSSFLQLAAKYNFGESNFEIAKVLLNAGLDVNAQDCLKNTALHYLAEKSGSVKMIQLFIDFKANVNIKNDRGEIPLFNAICAENLGAVRLLIDHGSDVNTVDKNGWSVLLQATCITKNDSNLSTVELLLKNGANIDSQDKDGFTSLHHLIYYSNIKNLKTVKLLLNYNPDVKIKDKFGKIPLCYAIENNYDVNIVQLLLNHGSDVNCILDNHKRITPLLFAAYCFEDSGKLIECLVKNGADTNALDLSGRTPLQILLETSWYNQELRKKILFLLKYSDINVIDQTKKEVLRSILGKRWKIILKHVAKLKALELPINAAYKNSISNNTVFSDYFAKCSEELKLAKSTKLKDCWVTFFNLLTDHRRKLKNYAGNDILIEEFEKSDCIKTYPIYGSEMQENLEKGKKRRKLFDDSAEKLSENWPIFGPTYLVIGDILDCLATKDSSKFIEEN